MQMPKRGNGLFQSPTGVSGHLASFHFSTLRTPVTVVSIPNGRLRPFSQVAQSGDRRRAQEFQSPTGVSGHLATPITLGTARFYRVSIPNGRLRPFSPLPP